MSSTITIVVPHADKESVFIQRVVQAAIRAHREQPKRHEVKRDTVNDDLSTDFQVAV